MYYRQGDDFLGIYFIKTLAAGITVLGLLLVTCASEMTSFGFQVQSFEVTMTANPLCRQKNADSEGQAV